MVLLKEHAHGSFRTAADRSKRGQSQRGFGVFRVSGDMRDGSKLYLCQCRKQRQRADGHGGDGGKLYHCQCRKQPH